MKKIIVGIFSLALLLGAQNAFAATWNGASNDCSSISIANATTAEGYQNPCWTGTSVSASGGDMLNVRIYYHNTGTVTANNTRIVVNAPTGSSTSTTKTFTGRIISDQGSISFGPVTANVSSAQTLTFHSAKWYTNNTAETLTPLIGGQSGSEVLSDNGLRIGSIAPGWSTQGSVVVAFSLSSNAAPQTCQDTSATNYGGALPCTYPTQTCQDHAATNYGGALPCRYPTQTCQDTSATNYGGALPCTYFTNTCTISNFTVNGSTTAYIQSGNAANFAWNTYGCTSVNVSGPNLYSSNLSGNQTTYPYTSGTYTITAYGQNGGTRTQNVYVNVNDVQNNTCTISNFTVNGSTTAYIQSGNAANFAWNTYGCTSVNVSGPNLYSSNLSGFQTTYPTISGNYILTGYSQNGGTQTRTVYVNVNQIIIDNPPYYPPVINSCAVTTIATNVTQNSAILNGLLSGSTGLSYFEYGTTIGMGLRTPSRIATGSFTEAITGLTANTPYYFRFVSQCAGGLSYGKIEVFSTQGAPTVNTVRQVFVQGTTVIGTESPIMLKIVDRYQYIGVGDMVDYTVTYKNIGKSKLTHPVLQVIVPKGITLTNSSRGTYASDTNTLTVELEDLVPGGEGVVYVQGVVNSIDSTTAQIVTTAVLVYTSPSGAQENAIAYVLNSPRGLNNLGASAFWAGLASIGLIGWLLIIILILLIILLSRRYYGTRSVVHTTPTGTSTTTHY